MDQVDHLLSENHSGINCGSHIYNILLLSIDIDFYLFIEQF